MTEQHETTAEPVHDELWSHLDWSFWGTGMADTFREPLADAMLAGITPEQREQANALITRWRDHREFVGRDKYEAQKAEIGQLKAELEQARTALAEPILADWTRGVTHTDTGTTVECVDADNRLRGIALELDPENREALGLMLIDPDGGMDQGDDGAERLRAAHFREAARLLEAADRDDDAVNLLDNVARGIEQQYEATPACSCHAERVHQAGCPAA